MSRLPTVLLATLALFESAFPERLTEQALIDAVVDATVAEYKAANAANQGIWRRDVHAKSHGLVDAVFTVENDIPQHLQVGVFARTGTTHRALIRFSNGDAGIRPDADGDGRGIAIKLFDVPGEKILPPAEGYDDTQDFLLINHPVFFVKDVGEYLALHQALAGGAGPDINNYLFPDRDDPSTWRVREKVIRDEILDKKVGNVLAITYWSMTPYALGEQQAVKYEVRPCEAVSNEVPQNPSPNYLREGLREYLAERPACFDFLVQVATAEMPVDDARVEWSACQSPFIKVARIDIPAQSFDTTQRNRQDENLTFSPWHALPAHRPQGSLNAVRGEVYQAISSLRHERNQVD